MNLLGKLFNRLILANIEKLCKTSNDASHCRPIFIIGVPRSGSTYLSQVLIHHFKLGFISNLREKFFGFPSLIPSLYSTQNATFESDIGRTQQLWGISECAIWWYRFFPMVDGEVPTSLVCSKKRQLLYSSVMNLQRRDNALILFKNLFAAMRLKTLAQVFPNAMYIWIKRDQKATSKSILNARVKQYNNPNEWLSIRPSNVEYLKSLTPKEQIEHQIKFIDETIQSNIDERTILPEQIIIINYDDLIKNKSTVLLELEKFFCDNKAKIERRSPHFE